MVKFLIPNYKIKNIDPTSISDLEEIGIIMCTCPKSSKQQLHRKIDDSFVEIKERGYFSKATEILVLAWNPLETEPSFE